MSPRFRCTHAFATKGLSICQFTQTKNMFTCPVKVDSVFQAGSKATQPAYQSKPSKPLVTQSLNLTLKWLVRGGAVVAQTSSIQEKKNWRLRQNWHTIIVPSIFCVSTRLQHWVWAGSQLWTLAALGWRLNPMTARYLWFKHPPQSWMLKQVWYLKAGSTSELKC